MRRLVLLFALALPLAAQDSALFPRFSITGAVSPSNFTTTARIDPDASNAEGTRVGFERDLGLERSHTLQRYAVEWRPFRRHELAATYFSAPRSGLQQIDRDIIFRNQTYPVSALVGTQFDLTSASLTYTYWARRSDRDGLGITLGASTLSLDASVTATQAGSSITIQQTADTDVPVALAGLQGRVAFTPSLLGEASVATLPRVTISDYTGHALTADARLEFRALRWLGIGAAYHYFHLNVDVAQTTLSGTLDMKIRGPEGYVRLAF
ncbi:MAG: hypothetical protein JO197_03325 [Acidobacteria bacterium]|nr:hypothetical protein [Acidobacteriota bacterium]MBV9476585.1 hypothetical protein [Acidobacteriota bacterium]